MKLKKRLTKDTFRISDGLIFRTGEIIWYFSYSGTANLLLKHLQLQNQVFPLFFLQKKKLSVYTKTEAQS